MIKNFLLAGIGIIFCGRSHSQQLNSDAAPAETRQPAVNEVITASAPNRFALPGDGAVTAFSENGMLYRGTVKRRRLQGQWESWYHNDRLCDSGSFVRGVPNGEWKHWDANGNLLQLRTFNADKYFRVRAEMERAHPRTAMYPITKLYLKNRVRARYYMQAGYSFSFLEHLPERFSLQEVVEHNINSGNEYRPVFEDCLHHGLFMNFFSDGRTRDSGYYKNGLKDGIWLHRDGQDNTCLVGVYRNGLRQGEWKQYNAAGKFIAVIIYNKDGVESWRKKLRN